MDFALLHGLKSKPKVYMSLSERMPGYLNKSQVPPMRGRPSRMVNDVLGHCAFKWQAALRPEMPAPTITTEKCSTDGFTLKLVELNATLMVRAL